MRVRVPPAPPKFFKGEEMKKYIPSFIMMSIGLLVCIIVEPIITLITCGILIGIIGVGIAIGTFLSG
jgi:hypothetical protein